VSRPFDPIHPIHAAGTEPYPWPYHGALEPQRMALVVAGAQPAWVDRSLRVTEVTNVIDRVAGALRGAGGQVVYLRHLAGASRAGSAGKSHAALPPPPTDGSAGLAFRPQPLDLVIDAAGISGFYGSALDAELRRLGCDLLVMTGFGAEATVDSTLRAANDRGYECLTLTDAVAPFADDTGRHALSSVTMSGGIFGAIGASPDLLVALEHASRLSLELP
jgi:biuret amidohydrolase